MFPTAVGGSDLVPDGEGKDFQTERCALQRTMPEISDATAAAAFRRLVAHLQHRTDAQNVDLMGLAGFCRNCLGDWLAEASQGALSAAEGREYVYGMPYAAWKAQHQQAATPEQLARMEESMTRNPPPPVAG